MVQKVWPIALIVLSNVFYHICAKSTPTDVNPFISLTVTYITGAVISAVCYLAFHGVGGLSEAYRHVNWSSLVLGVAVVGLEAGSISMYKAGWAVNTGQLVYSVILAICLIFVGWLLYHETLTGSKLLGILFCLIGLYFINR